MNPLNTPSEDALIEAALAVFGPEPIDTAVDPATGGATGGANERVRTAPAPVSACPPVPPESPTLAALAASRLPHPGTVCEACPNSVWFASPAELKCYCRVMFLITWSSSEPHQITHCDGALPAPADGAQAG